jgi:solute carrier family 25 (mitochondrial carnitine/acylcarnitine transporter), member 20/29
MSAQFVPELTVEQAWHMSSDAQVWRLLSGFIATGVTQTALAHPFDTLKVRAQCSPRLSAQWSAAATGRTRTRDLLSGRLFRGMAVPMLAAPLAHMTSMYAYDRARVAMGGRNTMGSVDVMFAGLWAGLWASLVETPLELIKCQVQARSFRPVVGDGGVVRMAAYRSSFEALSEIPYRGQECRGPMQGLVATMARNAVGYAAYYCTYEGVRRLLDERDEAASDFEYGARIATAGGAAGVAFWAVAYPLDTIKTRIQTDSIVREHAVDTTIRGVLRSLRAEGAASLWRGITPTLLRAAPCSAVTFFAFDWGCLLFDRMFERKRIHYPIEGD